jgi:enolase
MAFECNTRLAADAYFKKIGALSRVETALNDCYAAQPSNPLHFIADRLRDGSLAKAIDDARVELRLDGCGGHRAEAKVIVADGAEGHVAVRLTASPPHPTTVRKTVTVPASDSANRFKFITDVRESLACALRGCNIADTAALDNRIAVADGSQNFAVVGTAVATALSFACIQASARVSRQEPYWHLFSQWGLQRTPCRIPLPVIPLFGCGEHRAFGRTRVAEVCFIPAANTDTGTALRQCSRVFDELVKKHCDDVAAPNVNSDGTLRSGHFDSVQTAVDAVEDAMRESGLQPGFTAFIGIVIDAAWCAKPDLKYHFADALPELSGAQLAELLANLCKERKSIIYLEDPVHPADKAEARRLMSRVGATVSVVAANNVGGDLFSATAALQLSECNCVGARAEDLGSATRLAELAKIAQQPGIAFSLMSTAVQSEMLADIAVAAGARYLRAGGIGRGFGAMIYNRLADIDAQLREAGMHADQDAEPHARCVLPPAPAEPVVDVQAKPDKKKK